MKEKKYVRNATKEYGTANVRHIELDQAKWQKGGKKKKKRKK